MTIVENADFYTGPLNSSVHSHTCCEIFYLKKGKVRLVIEGKEYYPKENSVHIVSPMEKHALTCLSDEYERYIIFLNLYDFEVYFTNPILLTILKNRPAEFKHIFFVPDPDIEAVFSRCAKEYKENNSCQYTDLRMVNIVSELLILLYRIAPEQFSMYHDNGRVAQVQKYLEDNHSKPILIKETADLFFINQYYLTHTFKLYTGYSPKQYLKKIRLMHACRLLSDTKLSVEDVSLQSGFESQNDLSRQFRNTFGYSPTQFRKKQNITFY